MTMEQIRIIAALAVSGSLAGCWNDGRINLYTGCEGSCSAECTGPECEAPCSLCTGQCLPLGPYGFTVPVFLWEGDIEHVPDCPDGASEIVFEGYGDLDASHFCPSCSCSAPSCELPPGITPSSSTTCDGPPSASLATPEAWDGACTMIAPPSADIASIHIPSPTVSGCEPALAEGELPFTPEWPFRTFARACLAAPAPGDCDTPASFCAAARRPLHPGFVACIGKASDSEIACPEEYPDERVFYRDLDDTRACTPCECGPAEGGECSVLVSTYEDTGCRSLVGSELVTLAGPKCVAGPSMRVGSVEAVWIDEEPGACAPSGGVATGAVEPKGETVFCCRPEPDRRVP